MSTGQHSEIHVCYEVLTSPTLQNFVSPLSYDLRIFPSAILILTEHESEIKQILTLIHFNCNPNDHSTYNCYEFLSPVVAKCRVYVAQSKLSFLNNRMQLFLLYRPVYLLTFLFLPCPAASHSIITPAQGWFILILGCETWTRNQSIFTKKVIYSI